MAAVFLLQQRLPSAVGNGLYLQHSQWKDVPCAALHSNSHRRHRVVQQVPVVHQRQHSRCVACGARLQDRQHPQDTSQCSIQQQHCSIGACRRHLPPNIALVWQHRRHCCSFSAPSTMRNTCITSTAATTGRDNSLEACGPPWLQQQQQNEQSVPDFKPNLQPPEPNTSPVPVPIAADTGPPNSAVTVPATAATVHDVQQQPPAHLTAAPSSAHRAPSSATPLHHHQQQQRAYGAVAPATIRTPSCATHQQQQQQQQQQLSALKRPQGMSRATLRQLLQQQVQAATSWHQLQQLLDGRREQLTLKHMSLMVVQVARLQVAEQRRWQQQLYQQQRYRQYTPGLTSSSSSSSSVTRIAPPPPADIVQAATAGATAKEFEAFVSQLAAAVHAVLLREQCEMMEELMGKHADALADASSSSSSSMAVVLPASSSSSNSSSSNSSSSRAKFSHAPGPLSSYLADIIWGFAKLNCTPQDESMLLLWVEAFAAVAAAADAVSFSQVIWGLGQVGFWPGEDVLDSLSAELGRRMAAAAAGNGHSYGAMDDPAAAAAQYTTTSSSSSSSAGSDTSDHQSVQAQQLISCRALSNILWGFAVLGYSPPIGTLARVWDGSVWDLQEASPQALSNMIWAVAVLEVAPSQQWMEAWQEVALVGMGQQRWNCADIANAAWAVGKFAGSSKQRSLLPPLPWRLSLMRAARVAAAGSGSTATAAAPRELVATAWGLTAAGVAFSKNFTERLLTGVAAQRIHFKAREWCELLSVLAKQGVTPPLPWQRASHAVLQQRLRFFSARDFAAAAWALPQLGVEPRRVWRERFFAESYGQLFFLSPSSCCALVWGLGRLRWRPPRDWQDRLFLETYTKLAGFRAAELAGTLHGLAQLQLQPPVQWMWQATAVMALAAADMSTQELTTCLWALGKLRYRPPEPWVAALADRGAALLPAVWQQQQQDGGSSSSSGGLRAALIQQQQQQQRKDAEGAELRRRRQQLLQQIKQLEEQQQQQRRQQQQQRLPYSWQQQWQQQQSLLQLRGDLELLEKRMKQQLSHQSSAGGNQAQRQTQQQQQEEELRELQSHVNTADGDMAVSQQNQQQQRQQRWLGPGDVKVLLASLAQLQYTLPEDHPLMAAARLLRIRTSSSRHAHISSKSAAKQAAPDGNSVAKKRASVDASAAAGASISSAAGTAGIAGRTADDNSDIFCPATMSRAAAVGPESLLDASYNAANSSGVGTGSKGGRALHVAAKTALARRRRHGRRYSPQGSRDGEVEGHSTAEN